MLVKAYIPLEPDLPTKVNSYGLGWIHTELPNTLGVIGLNPRFRKEMPVVGEGLDRHINAFTIKEARMHS